MYITSNMMHNYFHMQHGVPTIGFPNLTHKYEKWNNMLSNPHP
jgi:hypothetical protein